MAKNLGLLINEFSLQYMITSAKDHIIYLCIEKLTDMYAAGYGVLKSSCKTSTQYVSPAIYNLKCQWDVDYIERIRHRLKVRVVLYIAV